MVAKEFLFWTLFSAGKKNEVHPRKTRMEPEIDLEKEQQLQIIDFFGSMLVFGGVPKSQEDFFGSNVGSF